VRRRRPYRSCQSSGALQNQHSLPCSM
jgi:hypothetical protein